MIVHDANLEGRSLDGLSTPERFQLLDQFYDQRPVGRLERRPCRILSVADRRGKMVDVPPAPATCRENSE
jgi:hypothetical protein